MLYTNLQLAPKLSNMVTMDSNPAIQGDWALALVDSLAEYMVTSFTTEILLGSEASKMQIPLPHVGLETLCETDRMVGKIASAYRNQGAPLQDIRMSN